jgi:hypothetical protein
LFLNCGFEPQRISRVTRFENFRQIVLPRIYLLVFAAFLAAVVFTRAMMFFEINLGPVDSDQPFMWIGASDYAKGKFHEPRFYGQDYNTFMEGLFAVPMIWCNVPEYVAVPLASQLIWLFPVLFTTIYLFRQGKKASAIAALAFFLLLPVEYDMMSSVPRGFMTGLFFCSFYVLSLFNPASKKYLVLNTLMAVLGFFVNPNSIIVSGPVLFYVFLHNYRDKGYYIRSFLCLLSAIPLWLILDKFYKDHPEYVMHGLYYEISFETFLRNVAFLPRAFSHLSLFVAGMPVFTFTALAVLALALWRSDKKALAAYLMCFVLVLVSCISNKTVDGIEWPFYSFSRMYLGVPFIFMLFLSFVKLRRVVMGLVILTVTVFTGVKHLNFNSSVARNLSNECWLGVHLVPLNEVTHAIGFYGDKCKDYKVKDLVVSNPFWLSSFLVYGGPAIHDDYPRTQENNNERRYWIRQEGETRKVPELIYISNKSDIDKVIATSDFELVRLDDYGLFLVKNNKLTINQLIEVMKAAEAKLR